MTEAGLIEAQYFMPWHIGLYLFVVFVIMVVYYQWKWTNTCKNNVLVLVQRMDGHGDFELAPQSGGEVSLKNPRTDSVKMWPINELSTIDVPYPGVGFIPAFLQKQIRMVVVSESDWEPITNRSPDREMIASPAVLGNLMHEKITEAVITVNKEMLDQVSSLMRRLNKTLSPLMFYIGIGVVIAILCFMAFQIMPVMSSIGDLGEVSDKLDAIMKALGVVGGQ